MASAPARSGMAREALPYISEADPDLGHGHLERLRFAAVRQDHVRHLGVQHCCIANDHDIRVAQALGAPDGDPLGVEAEVLVAVEGVARMRGPAELWVQEA